MKTNRREFIKKMNWGLAGMIGLLGFVSCEKENMGTVCAVKGTVVNKATQKAIKGIRVGYSLEPMVTPMYGTRPTPYVPKKHVMTGSKGEFSLTDHFRDDEFQMVNNIRTLNIYAQDIENGLFQFETLQVGFPRGMNTVNVKVELTEIENKLDG